MKKSILVIAMLVIFTSSATFVRESNGWDNLIISNKILKADGMNYLVIYSKYTNNSSGRATALQVINVTKDKLEVEKLRNELKER